jgi:subtilase family serine protease
MGEQIDSEVRMAVKRISRSNHLGAAIVLAAMGLGVVQGAVPTGQVISKNLPGLAKIGKNVGVTNPTRVIDVSIWLKIHDKAGLDALAADLYNKESSHYRQWISAADFESKYAPTTEEEKTVAQFLSSKGLSVVEVGPKNMFVRARGTVANVNKAFHVQLNDFELKGKTYFANTTAPTVEGAAGLLTGAVYGLHNLQYTHPYATQTIQPKNTKSGPTANASGGGSVKAALAPPISSDCFTGVTTERFNNMGDYPFVTLKGNGYAMNAGPIGGCGYTPPAIQTAYNLKNLYKEGFDGTGQTIVIIDWCGSPTIKADANAFSAAYGLPPLTSANFRIINSPSPNPNYCEAPDPEINIDVEWAHAIAPGANIDLVVPPDAYFQDIDEAETYAVLYGLGNVISGSYGSEEYYDALSELETEDLINEIAAVRGISANFSTGDSGDDTLDYPQFYPPSVSAPADSPWGTAIGGASLALKSNDTIAWQTGWGTNVTPIISDGDLVDFNPPSGFFNFGSGGGPSALFEKPFYQHKLKGTSRLLPDISWLADPYTGAVIVISYPFQEPSQVYEIYGGTSLACPMFSALWAIANQEAGAPLGQAAPYLYSMPASTITDMLPVTSTTNVTASYKESPTVTDFYTAADLAQPLENTTKFVSAIWNPPYQDTAIVLTFGTDSGLTVTKGWDNVTGLGVPNGKAFADYFNPAH